MCGGIKMAIYGNFFYIIYTFLFGYGHFSILSLHYCLVWSFFLYNLCIFCFVRQFFYVIYTFLFGIVIFNIIYTFCFGIVIFLNSSYTFCLARSFFLHNLYIFAWIPHCCLANTFFALDHKRGCNVKFLPI